MSAKTFVVILTAIYWVGVFTGSLSKVQYTNSNMDTFIHGGLATWGLWLSAIYVRDAFKSMAGTREGR